MIGTRIKDLRIKKGMTQEDVANDAGISYVMVGLIERDKANPSISMLEKIAEALDHQLVVSFKRKYKN